MGNGPWEKRLFTGLESPAIAHNEVAGGARFRAAGLIIPDCRAITPWRRQNFSFPAEKTAPIRDR
jgi:hypothetical protein